MSGSRVSDPHLSRRSLLIGGWAAAASLAGPPVRCSGPQPWFEGRAIAIDPAEAEPLGVPERVAALGLNVVDLCHTAEWAVGTEEGRRLIDALRRSGIGYEFSLHACTWFLPRSLFAADPSLFRMNDAGNRVPDANLCVHSETALDILCEGAVRYARILPPSTLRFHFWTDDGAPMCRCPKCRELSDSDQALVLENRLVRELRRCWPGARVAHLAYQRTLAAPHKVKPAPGMYLEYAPIERDCLRPLDDGSEVHTRLLDHLDANLRVFGAQDAEVLDYWLDNSRYAGWKREKVTRVPWNADAFRRDLRTYATRGIRRIRTYAMWFDTEYVRRWGPPPLAEYAAGLARWRRVRGQPVEARG